MSKQEKLLKIILTPAIILGFVGYRLFNNWLISPLNFKEYWDEFSND